MQKKFGLSGVLAFLLAVAAIMVAPASSSRGGKDEGVQVIRVTATTVQDAFNDVGDAGPSLGDQFVSSGDFSHHGEKVGTDGVVCTIVRVDSTTGAGTALCVAAADFHEGQLTAQVHDDVAEGRKTWSASTTDSPSSSRARS